MPRFRPKLSDVVLYILSLSSELKGLYSYWSPVTRDTEILVQFISLFEALSGGISMYDFWDLRNKIFKIVMLLIFYSLVLIIPWLQLYRTIVPAGGTKCLISWATSLPLYFPSFYIVKYRLLKMRYYLLA